MKQAVQQADEKQELTSPNRIKRFEYSFDKCQGDSSRVSFVRNLRERFETGAEKGNTLRNGNSYHYRRSDSVKSRSSDNGVDACGDDTVLSAKTKVSDIAVVNGTPPDIAVANGTLSIGSPVNCSDGSFIAENVDSTQHKPNGSSQLLRPSLVGPEKAQDRLVKSQSYIEQLQQNLATKLSTATVETFRHKYSPTLDPRSPSTAGRPQLIDSNQNENGNHDSREAVGSSSLTDGNQEGDRNSRQTPVPKGSVGKGNTPVSEFKSRKLRFLGVIFRPADTSPTRKLTNSHKNDTSNPDGSADSGQFLRGATHPVGNELTQLRSEYRNQDSVDSSPRVTSQNGLKGEVKNSDSVTSKTTDKDREATVHGNNSSCLTPLSGVNNPNCGKLSDESQQQTYTTPQSVDAVPPPKPARVSWTTRLIQKLTEEEEKRKTRSQTRVQKPTRIVGFPQKKVNKVINQYKAKASEESKKETPSPLVLQPATEVSAKVDTGSDSIKKETKENLSGVVLDEDSKDAYANVVSQLTDSKNEDNEQVSELNGEDLLLKQKNLEELRATLAREECGSISSDDDSDLLAAITASTGNIEAGRRKEPKPSGIRRLLPHGLFVQKRQHLDRAEEDAALERLLKHSDASRVYPATNTARPVLETAFLSDSNSKLPVRSAVRQQQRSQSSSPASRNKQASPRSRRRQKDADQKSIQENQQNSSKISSQARSKSLSPARDRRSSSTNSTSRRTIPDTSLVLEERLQHIRREVSPPPARDVRPSSTPPTDNLKRVSQIQTSSTSSSDKILQRERIYQNVRGVYIDTPDGAYYHSPPIRRRQQNKDPEIDHKADDKQRKVSGGSSASSTSTIVAESPPVSALSWNPLLLNLENQALSGSPDIRELQHQRQPQHSSHDGQHYGGFQNSVHRDSRTDSPDIYYHPNSGLAGKPKLLPELYQDPSKLRGQLRSPTSVPSGRLSAPPVSSYNIEDYPRRRVISPEPPRNRQEYQHEVSSKRSLSQPPRSRQSNQTASTQPLFQPALPTDKRLVSPVVAKLHVTSQPRPREAEHANSKETQTASSYMQQQYRQLAEGLRSNSQPRYKKLSRHEVEALYWETQKFREGLSSLSQRISHSPGLGERFLSTGSLPHPPRPGHHSAVRSEQNSPMFSQPEAVPRQPFRTQSVQNVGDGYGSVIVRPQPMYNIAQQYQLMQQSRASNDSNIRVSRARSASPGPNSNRHLPSRSLSLPRSVHALVIPEGLAHKASEDTVDYFKRGVPQRNTIGPIRTASHSPQIRQLSTPTIYEESPQQVGEETRVVYAERQKHGSKVDGGSGNKSKKVSSSKSQNSVDSVVNRSPFTGDANDYRQSVGSKKNKKSVLEEPMPQQHYYPPIFKRGSLISTSTCSVDGVDSPVSPKRVSFISSHTDEPRNWPTRNGPAPEPPTRQRRLQSMDSDVFLPSEEYSTYANVPEAPNRPLPPLPRDVNGTAYGVIVRKGRDMKSPAGAVPVPGHRWQQQSESESGSEAGEVQRILQQGSHGRGTYFRFAEEEWGADGKARGPPGTDQSVSNVGRDEEVRRGGGGRSGRRDEPRRHTLSGDHHHHQQGGALARSMDLEMSSKSQRRKSPLPRGYPPPSSAMLFDDDPGIMSEVETSSTGFRRGGKQRSSLPVVRTPSKTLERPLGLVFLQYRSETKRALLPNEITSIDTVKALFVRSFPKQLTMEYLDSPHVKIYIHDSSKDMFYELEDLRSHLRDIRDRSVLRLFESTDMNGGVLPGAGVGVVAPPMWDQDQSYFSEPEFDSEYQHQHIHKTKASSKSGSSGGVPPQAPYYMTHSYPPGGAQGAPGASATLPRGGPLLRAYSPAVAPALQADRIKTLPQTDRLHSESGYMSSPERGGPRAYPSAAYPPGPGYEDPYYSQYTSRSGSITPVIDEEASDTELIDESYSLYGVKLPTAGRSVVTPQPRGQFPAPAVVPYDATRIRVEHMERQLANLTGLVQKALTQTPAPREYLQVPPPASARDANYRNDDSYLRTDTKPPKLGKDKSVSFEKSVSFSDEPPDMNSPKQHSPQHAERTERDRHKPAPPPKPVSLSPGQYEGRHVYRDLQLTPEMYNQLRGLQKKAKDLRQEVRNLRRMSQAQAHSVRETIRDTFLKIRAMLLIGGEEAWAISGDADKVRLSREEDTYKQEMLRLEKDLTELEGTVEELRGNVINRKTRVNMSDVENMALILNKSSKTVADLKVRFPSLQEGMKGLLASEMEKVVREEKFLKEEPERLESALRRCKKLTGTLVTLKRLASVQEQRLPPSATPESRLSPTMGIGGDSDTPITPPAHGKPSAISARGVMAPTIGGDGSVSRQRPENALDALLDELQTFARPPYRTGSGHNPSMADIGRKGSIDSAHTHAPSLPSSTGTSSLRRLHSYPSSSDGGGNSPPTVALSRLQVSGSTGADTPKSPASSPKPPVPERNSELLSHLAGRRIPPPPPPRTSSRSPLASPTSPSLPPRGQHPPSQPQMGVGGGTLLRRGGPGRSSLREPLRGTPGISVPSSTAMAKQEDPNQLQPGFNPLSASNSSSCESINSQEGLQQNKAVNTGSSTGNKARQEILEQRHQELLRKQRALQEQYARLQQLQRSGGGGLAVVPPPDLLLKKTGSESNLLAKMGLGHNLSAAAPISGSLTHLAAVAAAANQQPILAQQPQKQVGISTTPATTTTNVQPTTTTTTTTTTNKIYETDIL